MSDSLLDLIGPDAAGRRQRMPLLSIGVVTNNDGTEKFGHVRVKLFWLGDDVESTWARIVAPMGGASRGAWFLPEVGDEVLIGFDRGDPSLPLVLGSLWSEKDKPPVTGSDDPKNMRMIKSRSGHIVRLDDTQGAEKIEIIDSNSNSIVFDAANKKITVKADSDISIESANGKVSIKGASVEITSTSGDVAIKSANNMSIEAGPKLALKAGEIDLN
jgi:uncharacterized protein involved in type VI secretion and phage assembly